MNDPDAHLWGGELVLRNGVKVGEVRSAAYGHTLNASVVLVQLDNGKGVTKDFIVSDEYQIDLAGELFDAIAHIRTPYNPKSEIRNRKDRRRNKATKPPTPVYSDHLPVS